MWDKATKWLIESTVIYAAQRWDERRNNKEKAKRTGRFVCKYCGAVYGSEESIKATKCRLHPCGCGEGYCKPKY